MKMVVSKGPTQTNQDAWDYHKTASLIDKIHQESEKLTRSICQQENKSLHRGISHESIESNSSDSCHFCKTSDLTVRATT